MFEQMSNWQIAGLLGLIAYGLAWLAEKIKDMRMKHRKAELESENSLLRMRLGLAPREASPNNPPS